MSKDFEGAKKSILDRLKNELNPKYYYHSLEHSKDVYMMATELGKLEKISENEMILLKTAALFHDSGFLESYVGHEEVSAKIAKKTLPEFNYNSEEIEIIEKMILSTTVPQTPETLLEKILCDADLDYLGRDDYSKISNRLFLEWKDMGNILTQQKWNETQINLFEIHNFFTKSSIKLRQKKKMINLLKLKNNY